MPDVTETLTGVKIMARAERKAILTIGYVQFVTDVQTALNLEDHLCNLVQVTSRWIDPDDNPDVHPNGMVYCASPSDSTVDVKLIERHHAVIDDPDWYDDFLAQKEEKEIAS